MANDMKACRSVNVMLHSMSMGSGVLHGIKMSGLYFMVKNVLLPGALIWKT